MSDTPYDELPYESQPIPYTAPEQLAMVSRYHGGPAPTMHGCRYLEVGCGDAANLLPLAFYRDDSRFVGIDVSVGAIDAGRSSAERIGVTNLELSAMDLVGARSRLEGPFDYIVAHGVLSWISPERQEALMELFGTLLATDGVGYVSYNTMPAGAPRGLMREALLRHVGQDTLRERTEAARALATFIGTQLSDFDDPYAQTMVREATRVVEATDAYLAHEILAPHNHAFWFRDFCALAERHGLAHVGDNWLYHPGQHPPADVWEAVSGVTQDPYAQNELADLLRYRQLRCSLVRRADGPLTDSSGLALLEQVGVAACLEPPGPTPSANAALQALIERWPRALTFDALLEEVGRSLGEPVDDATRAELAQLFHALFVGGHCEWRLGEPSLRVERGGEVRAHALARHEAMVRGIVTTPTHRTFQLSDEQRREVTAGAIVNPKTRGMLAAWAMIEAM